MRNPCNNKKVSKLPYLSKFVMKYHDKLVRCTCQTTVPDLSCETYLSTPQMVTRTVTSQNNLKNM